MKQARSLRILLGLAMLLMLPAVSSAQSAIVGLLTDDSGGVLPGVSVEATSPAMIEGSRTVTTDSQGRYRFEAMRPGSRSPLEARSDADLGRFGLGLKTASFSQCRRLTVVSRRGGVTPSPPDVRDPSPVNRRAARGAPSRPRASRAGRREKRRSCG